MKPMKVVSALIACIMLIASCSGNRSTDPSTEFAAYVKAYTGGLVSSTSSVRVEFASDMQMVDDQPLFSFSPSLKGSVRWISPSAVEFTPDEGTLSPGTKYKASFNLGAVTALKNPDLKKFDFSFMVAPKSAQLSVDGIRISSDDPTVAAVSGTVTFNEDVVADDVKSMLSVSGGGSPQIELLAEGVGSAFPFEITGIRRSKNDETLKVRLDASKKGFKTKTEKDVMVPAADKFKLVSAVLVEGSDPYIDVRFSEPLDASADDKGFFTMSNVGRFYTQTDDNQVKVYFDEMPSGSVGLKVSALLRDYNDNRLGSDFEKSFSSSSLKPEVRFAFTGSILPDDSELILPFRAIGLNAVDLSIIKIYESNVLMFLQDNTLKYGSDEIRRSGRLVYKTRVRLDGDTSKDPHQWEFYSVDLSNMFKKEPGAIYRIRLSYNLDCSIYASSAAAGSAMVTLQSGEMTAEDKDVWDTPYPYYYDSFYDWENYNWNDRNNPLTPTYYMESDRFPSCNLLTSNLGIIAKSADSDHIWVSVNDIISTDPISGAEVTAYNFQLQPVGKSKTDGDGFADIQTSSKPFALVVKSGKTTGYLKVNDGYEQSLSRFDVGGQKLSSGLKGFVYGERGVWRPGDTLHVSFLVEDKAKSIPQSHPVTMELYNPQGQFYMKQVNADGVNGLYVFNIPTNASDPTGIWNAYFKLGGASFHKSLNIETVKANRLKLALNSSDAVLESGKASPFNVTASWLTGPAASGLKTVAEMTLSRRSASFKGFEGYSFNNPISDFSNSSYTLFEKTLDGKGQASANVIMPKAEDAPGLLTANIITRVMEPGGDASIVTQTMPFSPFKSLVGVKITSGETYETDDDLKFPVVTVDAQGKAVSGDKIEYKIYKLDWSWWWESGRESLDSYVNSSSATPVSEGSFTSSSHPTDINFRIDYPEWGRYLVYVKDVTSGHASGGIIYIDWPSWRGRSEKSDPTGLTMLTFTTDKSSYEVGEEVTVFVPAAESGRALVSLENGRGVISRNWVKTNAKSDTQYKFKVTSEMSPNFYIHISLLQKHKRERNDLPIRMYGVQPVLVTDKNSHLEPVISVPEVIRPQEEFTVSVKEKSGKPMTYTLAIVDEGLLDITSFKTPDPWKAMNAREALGVKTWDLYDDVIGAFSGRFSPLMSVGGDEDFQVGNKKDNRFNPVVKFYGPYKVTKGEQKHKITLPMYVGSVRVMVVAGQDGAYGNAEKAVPVRTPLMILPTLPRAIGTEESVVLPVNVFAMEDNIKNVKVSVSVEGPARVSSESSTAITFSETGDKLVNFALATGTQEGIAKVTVIAESGSHKAQETIAIEVRNPNPPSSSSQTAYLKDGKPVKFEFDPFETNENSKAVLQLSNFPAVDFDGLFTYVKNYNYDCTEQLSSKGMTLVYTKQFLNADNAAKADEMIAAILQNLYSRQLPDGGFAYWPGNAYANEWATSMAGQFMTEASAAGYNVNKGVLASWKKFQKKAASNYKHSEKYSYYDLQQAYRLYTLALAGSADEGAMNRLKAAPNMTNQAKWRLAAAYAVAGKKNVAKQLIESLDTELPDQNPGYYTFGSGKDRAMLLETAVLVDEMQVAMELAEEVADMFEEGGFGTQYTAFSALAMNRLAKKVGDGAIEVAITPSDGKNVKSAKSSFSVDVDPSAGSLEVKNLSSGPVYAVLQTRRPVSSAKAVPAKNSNIAMSVKYVDMSGKEINPATLKQGQDFKVNIIVSGSGVNATSHNNLALTYAVPSGWEIFNERLFDTASEDNEGYSYKDIRDDKVIWYFDLPASGRRIFTVRLQAAYQGEYLLPAVVCEAMYDPSTYANTASGRTLVAQ